MQENGFPDRPVVVDDSSFHEVIRKYPLVVVDCWAGWCQPCRMIAPSVEELAKELKGKVVFGKLDVDANAGVPQEYGIMSIPTLLVFKGGRHVDTIIGAVPKSVIRETINRHM
ncbi:MAG: thioredoxin [Thermoplasmata archaeon]|uniref:Thioredoxin n=1 Tax=Candidatus Sysuiplasma superficiale TaxID=2823368 RepID=A0A8J7YTP8_9ARCH|nr:thioredoxin [Candidatus Sysuiplasma superficiale]MBX8645071.1 thioredoxin [Candidatus Sysuiplasma superficiale]MCL4346549.1 thioredoxin [Candidatus Thermoplasmatota archaeon]